MTYRNEFLARYGDDEHIKSVMGDYAAAQLVHKNPSLNPDALLDIHKNASGMMNRSRILQHPNFKHFDEVESTPDNARFLLGNPNTPTHILSAIHFNKLVDTRVTPQLYSHPNVPNSIHKEGLKSENISILRAAIQNPNTDAETLNKFVTHPNHNVRKDVLSHKNIPASTLDSVMKFDTTEDDDKHYAIQNPNTPYEHVKKWAHSPNEYRSSSATMNPNIKREDFDAVLHNARHNEQVADLTAMKKFYPQGYDPKQNTFTKRVNAIHKEVMGH